MVNLQLPPSLPPCDGLDLEARLGLKYDRAMRAAFSRRRVKLGGKNPGCVALGENYDILQFLPTACQTLLGEDNMQWSTKPQLVRCYVNVQSSVFHKPRSPTSSTQPLSRCFVTIPQMLDPISCTRGQPRRPRGSRGWSCSRPPLPPIGRRQS